MPDDTPNPNPTPRPRGGARPGAGAPKGNLNALKHGRSSQFAEIGALLARDPGLRTTLFHLASESAWRDGDPDLAMDFSFQETLRPPARPRKPRARPD